jgi:ethanolamine-phosphate cytidylyltransferase
MPNGQVVYVDGCFDLPHSGHYNAIRQAKNLSDFLVVGVNSDADILLTKGPSILNQKERSEILRHCKFADKVLEGTQYTPTPEFLKEIGCQFYSHGDDPCIDKDGNDICALFDKVNMFKQFKRTEGVSTTSLTAKLLALGDSLTKDKCEQAKENPYRPSPKQNFLATSRRIINFANSNMPKEGDTIVYIQGSFDILHHGHMKRLELAKKLGDFLYVGLWDDEMTRYYKGSLYPVQSLQERVLQILACKHVDDVVIGAPFLITQDLITSLRISKVVVIIDTNEDRPSKAYQNIDQF